MDRFTMIALLVALVILIMLSGFFSATETAYTGFSAVRMRRFSKTKRSARVALRLSGDYNKILTTLLIGNNIVNITSSTIGTVLFVALLGEGLGPTVSTVVITAVVLGGTSMSGGRGQLWGVVLGVLIIGVLTVGLTMIGVSTYWQKVIKGVIIVVAVIIDTKGSKSA